MSLLRNSAMLEPIQSDADQLAIAKQTIELLSEKVNKLKEKNARLACAFIEENEHEIEIARAQVKSLCKKLTNHSSLTDAELKNTFNALLASVKTIGKQLDAWEESQEKDDELAKENEELKKELRDARAQLEAANQQAAQQKQLLEDLKREHEALMEEELHALIQAALAEMRRYRAELNQEIPAALQPQLNELAKKLVDDEINETHASLSQLSYPQIEAIRKVGAINRLEANLVTDKPVSERCHDLLTTYNSQNGKCKLILERNRDTWLTAILKAIGVALSLGSLWKPIYRVKGGLVAQNIQTLFHPNKLQHISETAKLRQNRARSIASSQQNLCVRQR